MARPSEKTPEKITKMEQAAALGATVLEICFYADISPDTYYRWLKEDEELSERIEHLRQKPILKARQTVINGLDQAENARWFLERKLKGEFSAKQELEHQGNLTVNLVKYDQENPVSPE